MSSLIRCGWAANEPETTYHDQEWGVPVHDDRVHFEFLILEGAQAGLSWNTILKRREGYRVAFAHFDPEKVARYTEQDAQRLLADPGIIRNRLKVAASITNAQKYLQIQEEFGSFDEYVWRFVDGHPIINEWSEMSQIPATSKESDTLSKDLTKRGFKFVGSTIIYAHMQACGLANDHLTSCFRYGACQDDSR
ncbi:MAG TPA: DNA-3-methyladenine glycosylase I [Fimbriimonadaceae bacterium]|nr:DNA-3-methyladenine glycosylase I [Fimbriimonadaceae bacterium]